MAGQIDKQLDIIIADLDDYTRGEIVALAQNVNANLRSNPPLGTPIDTGWASANWVPSIGEPYDDPGIERVTFPGHKKGDPTPPAVIARARLQQQGLNDVLAWRNGAGPIFSTNNVPYIQPLNNGHSAQSPRGFVQAAIEKAVRQTYSRARSFRARAGRAATALAGKARPKL